MKPDKPAPKEKRRIIRGVKFDRALPEANKSDAERTIDAIMELNGLAGRAAPTVEQFKAAERTVFLEGLRNWIREGQSFNVMAGRDKLLGIEPAPPPSAAERWGVNPAAFATMVEAMTISGPSGASSCSTEEAEVLQAAQVAWDIIEKLRKKALEGNAEAAYRLASLASLATGAVWHCAEQAPELLAAIQRWTSIGATFPVFVGPHKDWRSQGHIDYWLDRFQIGAKAALNTEGYETHRKPGRPIVVDKWCNRLGAFVFDVPHMFALRIFFWGERGDPLDATWPEWFRRGYDAGRITTPFGKEQALAAFEIAWAALTWATDGKPESIPELYEMGRYKEGTASGDRKGIRGAAQNAVQVGIREKLRRVWLARYAAGKS